MKKADLLQIFEKLQLNPSKKLGQNFLIDDNFLSFIMRAADVKPGQNILEVGPGLGALTRRLLDAGARVAAIEFDRKLAAYLRTELTSSGLELYEGDACKADIPAIFGATGDFRLISNLPYSAGTVVVANMLDLQYPPQDMFIMLQKEVGERLAAPCGTSEYASLTVRTQVLYQVSILKVIPPEVFFPMPEVHSCIVRLTRREDAPDVTLRRTLSRLVRTAFAHRRKKMFRQVAAVFGDEPMRAAMTAANVDMDTRAERVSCAQFLAMARLLQQSGGQ